MEHTEAENRYRASVEEALKRHFSNPQIPQRLLDAMQYSVDAGGKRLRPSMLLACCDMLGGDLAAAMPLACGIEMIHTYSLIHDDLPCMDNDDFRRGKPSNHKMFGEGQAVLAGDGLLNYAFEVMLNGISQAATQGYIRGLCAIAKGAGVTGMIAGQSADLLHEGDPMAGERELQEIHLGKTAAMIRASLLAGAHVAGADEKQLCAIDEYGRQYGLLFQITDDIIDLEGDFATLGKTPGKDLVENKLTYPRLYGLEESRRMAQDAGKKAKEALGIFGCEADYFLALTDNTLLRRH